MRGAGKSGCFGGRTARGVSFLNAATTTHPISLPKSAYLSIKIVLLIV